MDEKTDKRRRTGIVNNETGEIENKISFRVIINHRRMKRHPENDFLNQVFCQDEDANLLFLPIGGGKHKTISGFGKREIASLDRSKDGEKLLFSQVNKIRDAAVFEFAK